MNTNEAPPTTRRPRPDRVVFVCCECGDTRLIYRGRRGRRQLIWYECQHCGAYQYDPDSAHQGDQPAT
jgi:predicted RNA-binding Zn-ribbon protein involved in translation (DUF1610 family)